MTFARNCFYVTLLLFWCTNFDTKFYYILIVYVLLMIVIFLLSKRMRIPHFSVEDKIALSFVGVWMYGIIVGLINGNQLNYIVANFAGMICYLGYFGFIYFNCSLSTIIRLLLFSGALLSIYSIVRMLSFVLGFTIPFISMEVGVASTGQLRVYFSTMSVAYALLGGAWYSFLISHLKHKKLPLGLQHKVSSFSFLILTVAAFFFVSASKGFLLGAFVIVLVVPFFTFAKNLFVGRLSKSVFILFIFFFVLYCILLYTDYSQIIEQMFSAEDGSNETRYDQLSFLLADCTFEGKGLGAIVPGIIRSEEGPYGFELTYINLIHKFGIFSMILFFNWVYIGFTLIKMIVKQKRQFYAIIALSSLGYMFPSIGNPLLMHPSLVMLNCFALFAIKKIREDEKNIGLYGHF